MSTRPMSNRLRPDRLTSTRILAPLLGALAVAGCVSAQDVVQSRENMLAAAGFVVRPANTPERQSALASLPPNKMVQRTRDATVAYLYADPLVCHCLYVGGQGAFGRYQQERLQQNLADEQIEAAQLNYGGGYGGFGWGPWGGFGPGFF